MFHCEHGQYHLSLFRLTVVRLSEQNIWLEQVGKYLRIAYAKVPSRDLMPNITVRSTRIGVDFTLYSAYIRYMTFTGTRPDHQAPYVTFVTFN